MTKKYYLGLLLALATPYLTAFALTPSITVTDQGDGNSSTINVTNGDPNTTVLLYYTTNQDGTLRTTPLGTTNYQGALQTTITTSSLGMRIGSPVYVTANGITSNSTMSTSNTMMNNNTGLTLTPNALSIGRGQSGTIAINGGNAPYTITPVNGDSLFYSFTGNSLTVNGATNGSRTMRVCSSNNLCGTFTTNITDTQTGMLSLSPSSITLNQNQSGSVQLMGGNTPYTAYMMNGNTISTSISGSVLTLSGGSLGASTLNICSSNGICSPLSVNVGGVAQMQTLTYSFPLAIAETVRITLENNTNTATYYVQSNSANAVTATIMSNSLSVRGVAMGTSDVTVCQTGTSVCTTLTFVVNQTAIVAGGTGGPYTFSQDMTQGDTNNDVVELQKYLIGEQYLNTAATGYFGEYTLDAVQRFQTAKGVPATGYVGALTRAELNNN